MGTLTRVRDDPLCDLIFIFQIHAQRFHLIVYLWQIHFIVQPKGSIQRSARFCKIFDRRIRQFICYNFVQSISPQNMCVEKKVSLCGVGAVADVIVLSLHCANYHDVWMIIFTSFSFHHHSSSMLQRLPGGS